MNRIKYRSTFPARTLIFARVSSSEFFPQLYTSSLRRTQNYSYSLDDVLNTFYISWTFSPGNALEWQLYNTHNWLICWVESSALKKICLRKRNWQWTNTAFVMLRFEIFHLPSSSMKFGIMQKNVQLPIRNVLVILISPLVGGNVFWWRAGWVTFAINESETKLP